MLRLPVGPRSLRASVRERAMGVSPLASKALMALVRPALSRVVMGWTSWVSAQAALVGLPPGLGGAVDAEADLGVGGQACRRPWSGPSSRGDLGQARRGPWPSSSRRRRASAAACPGSARRRARVAAPSAPHAPSAGEGADGDGGQGGSAGVEWSWWWSPWRSSSVRAWFAKAKMPFAFANVKRTAEQGYREISGESPRSGAPVGGDQLVVEGVERRRRRPAGWVRVVPVDDLAAPPARNGTRASQPGTMVRILLLSNTIEWALSPSRLAPSSSSTAAMASEGTCTSVRLDAGGLGDVGVDPVPRRRLVGGDVERLADRLRAAQQPDERPGEVGVVGDRPQRRAVAVDHDRRPGASARRPSSRPRTAEGCGRRCATGARSSSGGRRRGRPRTSRSSQAILSRE